MAFTLGDNKTDYLRNLVDIVRLETATIDEKQKANVDLETYFLIKFEDEGYADKLFKKLTDTETQEIDKRDEVYLAFIADFNNIVPKVIAFFLEKIKDENFKNDNPEVYFKNILRNKIVDAYRKRSTAIDKALKAAIKREAKKPLTIKDFYKYFDYFLPIIRGRKNQAAADAYEADLFSDFSSEQKENMLKSLSPFKELYNIETIWAAIQKENQRCFHEEKCSFCKSVDDCFKHEIMLRNKRDGISYEQLAKDSRVKSLRELMSRRMKKIENFYQTLIKKPL